jgi:hypothetical protein
LLFDRTSFVSNLSIGEKLRCNNHSQRGKKQQRGTPSGPPINKKQKMKIIMKFIENRAGLPKIGVAGLSDWNTQSLLNGTFHVVKVNNVAPKGATFGPPRGPNIRNYSPKEKIFDYVEAPTTKQNRATASVNANPNFYFLSLFFRKEKEKKIKIAYENSASLVFNDGFLAVPLSNAVNMDPILTPGPATPIVGNPAPKNLYPNVIGANLRNGLINLGGPNFSVFPW